MDKRFLAIVGAIIVVFIGVAVFAKSSDNNSSSNSATSASNHVKGAGTTGVTLLEYGDFACPACKAYHPIVAQVLADYGDKIKFQYRNFPLTSLHPNAYAAARSAEAASKQGKFWEMYDALFSAGDWSAWGNNSKVNGQPYFDKYAKDIGLDMTKFETDRKSDEINKTIRADMAAGEDLGITSTPTFFINGKKLDQPGTSPEEFKKQIDAAIAEQAKKNQ